MGWSEMDGRCRRHPKHPQSKGVCPSCLRERLSQLSAASSTLSSSGSSYDSISSSTPSSSTGSPSASHRQGAKLALLMKENAENPRLGRPEPLTKSRSLAFVISNPLRGGKKDNKEKREVKEDKDNGLVDEGKRDEEEEERKKKKKKKKKEGFWSKLAVAGKKKRKEKDALLHSKSVREAASARWAFLP